MGQLLPRLIEHQDQQHGWNAVHNKRGLLPRNFPDLTNLPPEVGLHILSNLNATDLCLAGCVWSDLADDQLLWMSLCKSQWGYVALYYRPSQEPICYKRLYLQLDEATLTFNAEPELGIDYLVKYSLIEDSPEDIALFLHNASGVDWRTRREFLERRPDVLEHVINLQNFENQFLPNALRRFFSVTCRPPTQRGAYLSSMVDQFARRFCQCNPTIGLSIDTVYLLCYSLIMLSVDLTSPHIKNKMSKREFIRNTRNAAAGVSDELAGHLYDNVYLVGHVAYKI